MACAGTYSTQGPKGSCRPPDGGILLNTMAIAPVQSVTLASFNTNKQALEVIRVPNTRGPRCPGPLLSPSQPTTLLPVPCLPPSTVHTSSDPFSCVLTTPCHRGPNSAQHENLLGVFRADRWLAPIPQTYD